jgi:hypothetical protein
MGVAEVDAELARLDAASAGISANLIALESNPGSRFLNEIPLSGVTEQRWTGKVGQIWVRYDQFRDVLDRAHAVRARRTRPTPAELAELTELLSGGAVALDPQEIPLAQRDLLGPAALTGAMTLAEVIAGMTAIYREIAPVAVAAESVSSAFLPEIDRLDNRLRAVSGLVTQLGLADVRHPLVAGVAGIADGLNRLRAVAMSDPLELCGADSAVDMARLRRAGDDIAAAQAQLDRLVAERAGFEDQLAAQSGALDDLAAADGRAAAACAEAREKVGADAPTPPVPVRAALTERLSALRASASGQHWTRSVDALAQLTAAIAAARTRAEAAAEAASALVGRRLELRGRLDAYRVKAAQLRVSEDPEISARYERAYGLLWTRPTDLAAATKALNEYQRAIGERSVAR